MRTLLTLVFWRSWKRELIVTGDKSGILWTKYFCLCGFLLLFAGVFHEAVSNAFRKEDFHSLYQSISRTEKPLIPTIVAHSRKDISPQSLFKWLSGGNKVKLHKQCPNWFISLYGERPLLRGDLHLSQALYGGVSTSQAPQHCPPPYMPNKGIPSDWGNGPYFLAPVSFSGNFVFRKDSLSLPSLWVRGGGTKTEMSIKTPQALGTISFCVDLTFKSWVCLYFHRGGRGGGQDNEGWAQGSFVGGFLMEALDQDTLLTVGSKATFVGLNHLLRFSLPTCLC